MIRVELHRRFFDRHALIRHFERQRSGRIDEQRLRTETVVLRDQCSAVFHVLHQLRMRRFHGRPRVVRAHAGDERVVLREVAVFEIGVGEKVDVISHLAQRIGNFIAGAHDVADARAALLHVFAHEFRRRFTEHALCGNVRIVDVGEALRDLAAVRQFHFAADDRIRR